MPQGKALCCCRAASRMQQVLCSMIDPLLAQL